MAHKRTPALGDLESGAKRLQLHSHRPKYLVNSILKFSASKHNLTASQLEARNNFVEAFNRLALQPSPISLSRDSLEAELFHLATMLDLFFFGGELTKGGCREALLAVEAADFEFFDGCLGSEKSPRNGKVTIQIELTDGPRYRQWKEVLKTLVHELAHAFLMAFVCRCGSCGEDDADGHGDLWSKLNDRILRTVPGWFS